MCISRFWDYKENLQSKILKRWVIMKEHMIMIRTYGNVIMGKLENHKRIIRESITVVMVSNRTVKSNN